MKYSMEEQKKMQRILDVFKEYIQKSEVFDVVNTKVGYLWVPIVDNELSSATDAYTIESASGLCRTLLYNLAMDTLFDSGMNGTCLWECGLTVRERIRKVMEPYMRQLPDYHDLMDRVFDPPSV